MIEYVLVFLAGIVYGIAGLTIQERTDGHVNQALRENDVHPGFMLRSYVDFMVVLLWPLLGFLFVLTTGYAALSGVSE